MPHTRHSAAYSPFSSKSKKEPKELKPPNKTTKPIISQRETLRLLETILNNKKLASDPVTGRDINPKNTKATISYPHRLEEEHENEFLSVETLKQEDHAYLDHLKRMGKGSCCD